MIEALLFASEAPLSAADLARIDDDLDEDRIEELVAELKHEYEEEERAFGLYEIAGGYQILTRPEYASVLERYETVPVSNRLSSAALETLAIIAYRQPVGRAEVEEIRGVGAGGVLKTLLERNLVEVVGRGEGLGRPLLYGTTRFFLEHFGFRGLEELPRSEELDVILAARPNRELDEEDAGDDLEAEKSRPDHSQGNNDDADRVAEPEMATDPAVDPIPDASAPDTEPSETEPA